MPIENILIRDLSLDSTSRAYDIENVRDLRLENVSINGEKTNAVLNE